MQMPKILTQIPNQNTELSWYYLKVLPPLPRTSQLSWMLPWERPGEIERFRALQIGRIWAKACRIRLQIRLNAGIQNPNGRSERCLVSTPVHQMWLTCTDAVCAVLPWQHPFDEMCMRDYTFSTHALLFNLLCWLTFTYTFMKLRDHVNSLVRRSAKLLLIRTSSVNLW